jgi:hypothetical protein
MSQRQSVVLSARLHPVTRSNLHSLLRFDTNPFSKPIRNRVASITRRFMDPWLEMLLHSIEASKPPSNYQEFAAQESIIGTSLSIGAQLAILDDRMSDIQKTDPRQRSDEINTDVVLSCPIVTLRGPTDDEKHQHRNALGRQYARKARQKKKKHHHDMVVELEALQDENTQLKSQIGAMLVSLTDDTT